MAYTGSEWLLLGELAMVQRGNSARELHDEIQAQLDRLSKNKYKGDLSMKNICPKCKKHVNDHDAYYLLLGIITECKHCQQDRKDLRKEK